MRLDVPFFISFALFSCLSYHSITENTSFFLWGKPLFGKPHPALWATFPCEGKAKSGFPHTPFRENHKELSIFLLSCAMMCLISFTFKTKMPPEQAAECIELKS
jgi:hypothetical protein